MFYFAKPTGGLYVGKRLVKPPVVREINVGCPARVLFFSDLHLRRNTWQTAENVFSIMRNVKHDMVLFGGDIAENDDSFRRFFEALKGFRPALGMYAVEGNNDEARLNEDKRAQIETMAAGGVRLLRDEKAVVHAEGGDVEIVGARSVYFYEPNVRGLFSENEKTYKILLIHEPHMDTLKQTENRANLALAGHTHGGQINFLGFTCYALSQYENIFHFWGIAGQKRVGNTLTLISRGIGTSKLPIRFGARPEAHLIY